MTTTATVAYALRLPAEEMEAVRARAEREGLSINQVIVNSVHDSNSRRVALQSWLGEIDADHAATFAELADR